MEAMNHAISAVEGIIGYTFQDKTSLWESLQAPGAVNAFLFPNRKITADGHKRMAIWGDAEMTRMTAKTWYKTKQPKVHYDMARQAASNKNLQDICKETGLHNYISLNPSQQGFISPKVMADTVEAIIGAVAEDGDDDAVRKVMKKLKLLSE